VSNHVYLSFGVKARWSEGPHQRTRTAWVPFCDV
jgi:hypothetical protein